jgi:hypothetical protein
MVAIIETRHRTHPRLEKQPPRTINDPARMARPGAAIAASPALTHFLLNSGESRSYVNEVMSRCTLRFTRALVRRGTLAISRPLGTYATLGYGRGGLVLIVGKNALPITVSAVALDAGGSDLWGWIMMSHNFFKQTVPGYRTGPAPERPEATPWIATLDLPHAAAHGSPVMAERLHRLAGEVGVALAFLGAGK